MTSVSSLNTSDLDVFFLGQPGKFRAPGRPVKLTANIKKVKKEMQNCMYVSGSQSKEISNDQEVIQSDPTSCSQNQKGNN